MSARVVCNNLLRRCHKRECFYTSKFMRGLFMNNGTIYYTIKVFRESKLANINLTRGCCSYTNRTHNCGTFRKSHIGQNVEISGWLLYRRRQFLVVRDWSGTVQIFVPEDKQTEVQEIPYESVVRITGPVKAREEGQENPKMDTGEIEIIAETITVLNKSKPNFPINLRPIDQSNGDTNEALRMKYRYLDIRRNELQRNLRLRSSVTMKMREFLCQNGFVDVDTPTLFTRTPGGAREFIVPSHQKGQFYCLPQSPQQFKQLLMVGGIDKYFQIAKCYRDEGGKPDRQPEFTQVDIELSFTREGHVRSLIENLLHHCWPRDKGELTVPFPCMTYHDAMTQYGSDKPDTRYDMKVVSNIMKDCGIEPIQKELEQGAQCVAIVLPLAAEVLTKTDRKKVYPKENYIAIKIGVDGKWRANTKKLKDETVKDLMSHLKAEDHDMIILSCGHGYAPNETLGKVRTQAAILLDKRDFSEVDRIPKDAFNFVWVVDFPLFLPKEEGDGLESAHHPFTAPHPDDEGLLYTDPMKVRSQHYDLVLNGAEIGGGSIRIHNSDTQRYVLEQILKEDSSELEHLLEALSFGCPPHGGIALGLDRLLAVLCNANSIRDVIAFPKTSESKDLMCGAPSTVEDDYLAYYNIQVRQ